MAVERSAEVQRVLSLLPPTVKQQDLEAFLEGFPRRYLETHTPHQIAAHFQLAERLPEAAVQVDLQSRQRFYELTVLTHDRPFLFASVTGTLAAWGMNILKADAFANAAGIVLDTFRFEDLFRTLDLNPSEIAVFKEQVSDVVFGRVSVQSLLLGRVSAHPHSYPKLSISTRIQFDDHSSSHSTLLELITQDRPGLLFEASSTLAEQGCNIEVALIDTEGQKVIDVFYLTRARQKLDAAKQEAIRKALLERLEKPHALGS